MAGQAVSKRPAFGPKALASRFAASAVLLFAVLASGVAGAEPRHGLSIFGELKYPPGFKHFDYVNPDAPKGGTIRVRDIDSYDSLNPFVLKGNEFVLRGLPDAGFSFLYASLMVRAYDETDAVYGLVADSADVAGDGLSVTFHMRDEARFHDGTPITAGDVVATFEALVNEGHPRYRIEFRDVTSTEALSPREVRFTFRKGGEIRDLPVTVATMPILSRSWLENQDFAAGGMEPLPTSGPYRFGDISAGRSVTLERVPDYWAKDLPVNVGHYNFDRIRVDYYRDRTIALEAFFAGAYDFREEFTSRSWATEYDPKPAVRDGRIVRAVLPDNTISGVQAFFLNTRREKFQDRRVRAAMAYAFDFEWQNENLFHGLYQRTQSIFENSDYAADEPPSEAELALLEPYRDILPGEVFETPYRAPKSKGNIRHNLRIATRLLKEAGWEVRDGVRVNAQTGEPLEVEFLLYESSFLRIVNPYIENLRRLGIKAEARVIDVAAFQNRVETFDYDTVVRRFVMPLTPGPEQRNLWSSETADVRGSLNAAGVRNPAVDMLVEKIARARDRTSLIAATRALDRVIMWNYYLVPQWFKASHHIAYWDKFSRPSSKPDCARGVGATWGFDADKAARLGEDSKNQSKD